MNPYIQKPRQYFSASPSEALDEKYSSVLDLLYQFYSELRPIDNLKIRRQFQALEEYFSTLSQEENDKIFGIICHLCGDCERQAFLEGLRLGARLMAELE